MPLLMFGTVAAIAAFQGYWLSKAYEREERSLDMRSNWLFRETVFSLQASKLRLPADSSSKLFIQREINHRGGEHGHGGLSPNQKLSNLVNIMVRKFRDSSQAASARGDSLSIKPFNGRSRRMLQFLYEIDSLQDSVTVHEIENSYARRLKDSSINVSFHVSRVPTLENDPPVFNQVTLGFQNPITYQLDLISKTPYLLRRISIPLVFSFFLIAFTVLSFALLYRNLRRQQRLADSKNEFISNITHELKTPIATVSVAIEALRSFNASMDMARTKEYLDISANELQRLSLLVDKVLKLSMFEKKEIELKYEPLDMKDLVNEVTASMRLQFEKHSATVTSSFEGNTAMQGDRLHLVSVIFNLLDNALKYSKGKPSIQVLVRSEEGQVMLCVADKGIGIPAGYQQRIFEKFFRVPTGNLHNAKGYGLGLSYVAHVVEKHHGRIKVESAEGGGSKFFIWLPKDVQAGHALEAA